MNDQRDKEFEELIRRIAVLEIDNLQLKKEIKDLKSTCRSKSKFNSIESKEARAKKGIFLDKNQTEIDLGDKVYIVTAGAHTDRSRRSIITGFDKHRNRVYILDKGRVTQERAPKNVKIEAKHNQA